MIEFGIINRIERMVGLKASFAHGRDAYRSIANGEGHWRFSHDCASRSTQYPMSFYEDSSNVYYSKGWGCHQWQLPWTVWAIKRAKMRRWEQEFVRDVAEFIPDGALNFETPNAINLAEDIIDQFIEDEQTEFGHPEYAWDKNGALQLVLGYIRGE